MTSLQFSYEEILLLNQIKGLGLNRLQTIIKSGYQFEDLIRFKPIDWSFLKGVSSDRLYHDLRQILKDDLIRERIAKTLTSSDKLLFYWEEGYPELLRRVYSPPVFLSCKGNTDLFHQKQVAIVGTRTPTDYGKKACAVFTKQFVEEGNIITSGMAKGIDTIAHQTALDHDAKTIAILGSGIETIYPSQNRQLYHKILKSDGLIISEHLHDAKPDAVNFPMRNRIIAGMVESTIVIEAGIKSGAVITANLSADLGKSVYAVPGSIFSPESEGCNLLLQEGAYVLTQYDDFMVHNSEIERHPEMELDLSGLNESDAKIFNELRNGPRHIDQLARKLELSSSELLISLLNLEMRNLIIEADAKVFQLRT